MHYSNLTLQRKKTVIYYGHRPKKKFFFLRSYFVKVIWRKPDDQKLFQRCWIWETPIATFHLYIYISIIFWRLSSHAAERHDNSHNVRGLEANHDTSKLTQAHDSALPLRGPLTIGWKRLPTTTSNTSLETREKIQYPGLGLKSMMHWWYIDARLGEMKVREII